MTLYLVNVIGRESNICVTQKVNLRKDSEHILADPRFGATWRQISCRKNLLFLQYLPSQREQYSPHSCWERLRAGGEGGSRGWDGCMASLTLWTWVWASSRRWWRTGKAGVLQPMGSQRVGHDWVTEQQQQSSWRNLWTNRGSPYARELLLLLKLKPQGKVYPRVKKCHHHVLELLLSTLSYPRDPISVQLASIVAWVSSQLPLDFCLWGKFLVEIKEQ